MMHPLPPEDDNAAHPALELDGQLSFDDLTHQLFVAIGAGDWDLIVDDPQGREG